MYFSDHRVFTAKTASGSATTMLAYAKNVVKVAKQKVETCERCLAAFDIAFLEQLLGVVSMVTKDTIRWVARARMMLC